MWPSSLSAELEAVLLLLAHEHLLRIDEDLHATRVQAALHAAALERRNKRLKKLPALAS